jgi:hypothetical protein
MDIHADDPVAPRLPLTVSRLGGTWVLSNSQSTADASGTPVFTSVEIWSRTSRTDCHLKCWVLCHNGRPEHPLKAFSDPSIECRSVLKYGSTPTTLPLHDFHLQSRRLRAC